MLSGIWPRGSSRAPGSGNTGLISGRSAGPRYSKLIGISRSLQSERALRNQDRRQLLPPLDRGVVGAAPGFEELHELLARAVVIPLAVAPDDLEQLVGRRRPVALCVE